jgi:hypothetical protein
VKVLLDGNRTPLSAPFEINLWEGNEGFADAIEAPVDAVEYGIEPLAHM